MKQVCTSQRFNDVFLSRRGGATGAETPPKKKKKEAKFALRADEFTSRGETITRRDQPFPCATSFQLPFSFVLFSDLQNSDQNFLFLKAHAQMYGGGAVEVK